MVELRRFEKKQAGGKLNIGMGMKEESERAANVVVDKSSESDESGRRFVG